MLLRLITQQRSKLKASSFYQPASCIGRNRWLSSVAKPFDLKIEAIVGIYDTILLYLMFSNNGMELERLQNLNISVGERWRKMTEVMVRTHLYVIAPFGFQPDPEGIKSFAVATSQVLSKSDPSKDMEYLKDLQDIQRNTWGILVKKAFGLNEVKWLETSTARSLALGICSNLSNPVMLQKGETISKRSELSPESKLDLIHNEIIFPSYQKAMATFGMPTDEKSYAMVSASIQVLASSDPIVAQTMGSGLSLLMEKVPLLRGEIS